MQALFSLLFCGPFVFSRIAAAVAAAVVGAAAVAGTSVASTASRASALPPAAYH